MHLNLDWRREASALWPGVSYELRPLRVWAFHELLAFWESRGAAPQGQEPGGQGAGGGVSHGAARPFSAAQALGLTAVAKRVLPEHVRALEGITVSQGGQCAPASLEALCEEAALLPLAGEIIARLVEITELSPAAEKN